MHEKKTPIPPNAGSGIQFKKLKNLAFDFCRFYVVIRFLHPRHNCQWPLYLSSTNKTYSL